MLVWVRPLRRKAQKELLRLEVLLLVGLAELLVPPVIILELRLLQTQGLPDRLLEELAVMPERLVTLEL